MPIPNGIQTAALIAGTVIGASGLNLAVIALGDPEPVEEPVAQTAESTTTDDALAAASASVSDDGLIVTAALVGRSDGTTEPADPAVPAAAATVPAADAAVQPPGSQTSPAPQRPAPTRSGGAGPPAPAVQHPAPAVQPPAPPVQPPAPPVQPPAPPVQPPAQPSSTRPSSSPAAPSSQQPSTQPRTQTDYVTYEFDGIANIVVALHNGTRLEFWSAATEPGWVFRVDDNGPGKVKVKFMRLSDGEEAEFQVKLDDDGDLDVKMEA